MIISNLLRIEADTWPHRNRHRNTGQAPQLTRRARPRQQESCARIPAKRRIAQCAKQYNASMEETLAKLRREQGNTPGFEDVERRFHEIEKSVQQQAAEMGVTSLTVHVNSDRGNG